MVAVGCLMPIVLALAGALLGHLLIGAVGAMWGMVLGFFGGGGIALFVLRLFARLRDP